MRKLIIFRGNSGSGKTTIAKELQNRFGNNTMLISQDVIRRDMLKVKDGERTTALQLMKELLIYGTEVYAYYFDLSFEETLKRHQTKLNCHEFGEEAMKRWWREKDFSDVLNEVIITAEKNIESIVREIVDTVSNGSIPLDKLELSEVQLYGKEINKFEFVGVI